MRNQFEGMMGLLKWARAVLLLALALGATSAYSASKVVLVLGDSLSAEYGLGRGDGWVALLEKRLADNHLNFDIVNASISGETTSGGKSRLPALLEKNHPAVVIVELGANDGLRGLPLAETRKNLQDIVSAAKKANARVLLVGMQLPPNYGTDYTKRFAALFPALAKDSKVALVPFLLEGVVTQPQLFQADRIHPTAAAHPIILDNVWPHLKPLLGK
ncbi:acyl-CoA thioesterase-1 [Actimicrobium sp. GrIS 1.19]|uniref:arylesterase n=1 Tax=Actimicrobium sp. GrIS 1.19 TaxID=3071708 RepID=UPI002DF8D528|nr:acyl-CoA thioesterase-1 [Actimicrobium sp. GrIS 1.19]